MIDPFEPSLREWKPARGEAPLQGLSLSLHPTFFSTFFSTFRVELTHEVALELSTVNRHDDLHGGADGARVRAVYELNVVSSLGLVQRRRDAEDGLQDALAVPSMTVDERAQESQLGGAQRLLDLLDTWDG